MNTDNLPNAINIVYIWKRKNKNIFNTPDSDFVCISGYYCLPQNMSLHEAYMVISYLRDYVKNAYNFNINSVHNYMEVINLLSAFGFEKSNDEYEVNKHTLYIFQKSNKKAKKLEWYQENITFEDIETIYNKLNLYIPALIQPKTQNIRKRVIN